MRAYIVTGGTAQLGAGDLIGLSPLQFAGRAHRVDVVERTAKLITCRPREILDFKAGETIHLTAVPSKAMADRLVPADGEDDGRLRPAIAAAEKASAVKPKKPRGKAGEDHGKDTREAAEKAAEQRKADEKRAAEAAANEAARVAAEEAEARRKADAEAAAAAAAGAK